MNNVIYTTVTCITTKHSTLVSFSYMQRCHTNWYLAVINLFAFDCIWPWSSILIQETVNQEDKVY